MISQTPSALWIPRLLPCLPHHVGLCFWEPIQNNPFLPDVAFVHRFSHSKRKATNTLSMLFRPHKVRDTGSKGVSDSDVGVFYPHSALFFELRGAALVPCGVDAEITHSIYRWPQRLTGINDRLSKYLDLNRAGSRYTYTMCTFS